MGALQLPKEGQSDRNSSLFCQSARPAERSPVFPELCFQRFGAVPHALFITLSECYGDHVVA
jgi:hypothetical protein